MAAKARYQTVEAKTGVPWFVIAVIHERESSQSWFASLAQGDRWDRKSVHVPANRGPFKSWEEAAIDALVSCAPYLARNKDWSIGGSLTRLEEYNGLGYASHGVPSPYLLAGTDQYHGGKYVRDGVYDPHAVDPQPGCAGLLLAMKALDPSIVFATASAAAPVTVPAVPPTPTAPDALDKALDAFVSDKPAFSHSAGPVLPPGRPLRRDLRGCRRTRLWDHLDAGLDDGVCWALKRLSEADVIVFRGSSTFADWIVDFRALPIKTRIGHAHNGFHAGMEHAWADVRALLKQPAIIPGNSLGAARASILTAFMVKDGAPPVARAVFGEPKPGFDDLAELVDRVPGRFYRNGDGPHYDLVTDVPLDLPPDDYIHPSPLIPVCAPPAANDQWGPFSFHHIELYQVALAPHLVPVSI